MQQETEKAETDLKQSQAIRFATKQIIPLSIATVLVWMFMDQIRSLDLHEIQSTILSVSVFSWIAAAITTVVSFWAVGQYDATVHKMLGTKVPCARARRSGIMSIAISQTTGAGVVTGGLARWRLLPELSLWQCTQISIAVALTFLGGWAVITAVVLLLFPVATQVSLYLAIIPIIGLIATLAGSILQPQFTIFGQRLNWPPVMAVLSILALVLIDTIAAAATLFVLMPDGVALSFQMMFPIFLLAFGAGLLAGTPGGIGPFEITMVACLPFVDQEALLGAICAYRILYYAIPAVIGAAFLIWPPTAKETPTALPEQTSFPDAPNLPQDIETLIAQAPRAEANLLRQGDKEILFSENGQTALVVAQSAQSLIAVSDPLLVSNTDHAIDTLINGAQHLHRIPALYKCGIDLAQAAARAGFYQIPIAQEAWIAPATYTVDTPRHKTLRRKLRLAQKAGVELCRTNHPPFEEMRDISNHWRTRNNGERGFSMGVFDPAYICKQELFLAYAQNTLAGFATFSRSQTEWTLDIIRAGENAPDGTMHFLIHSALELAKAHNLQRVSLASVAHPNPMPRFPTLGEMLAKKSGRSGLLQFKQSFAPEWETLYFCAPSAISAALSATDIMREICSPRPIRFQSTVDAPISCRL
ncbi:bifunctional lysylphosphatidylglycerol flippase/synthetase MprF [Cochlodiniinecator piscidefendens]|uniref:bifunctional lysylphosphatidylglycerol flippase/synthetase MprF n=1 Tax=Cochlodiniinecator piscidefendens TaxID=2715756 RepID=UPI001408BBCC|nr:phosphatidylglycerol lysyltransferase domain-containing protein [Cochlodiniinecator piscidefendens]